MNSEHRLIEIEIKLTRQEDMLDSLNQLVYRQQTKIDELEKLCAALALRMKEMAAAAADQAPANERPPHY